MNSRTFKVCLILIAAAATWSMTATAQTVRYVTPTGGGALNGTTWGDAYSSIQTAVATEAAGTGAGVNAKQFWVKAGTYTRTAATAQILLKAWHEIYGGFAGTETALASRDWAANASIIDGAGATLDGLATAYIKGPGAGTPTLVLDGLTIQNVKSTTKTAAIYTWLTETWNVRHCIFKDNPGKYGGAVGLWTTTMNVENCLFTGNSGTSNGGGAIWTRARPTTLNIINSTFAGNSTTVAAPAPADIFRSASTTITVKNSILWSGDGTTRDSITPAGPTVSYSDVNNITALGGTNIKNDPLFVGGSDYSLQSGSPAKDTATVDPAASDKSDLAHTSTSWRPQGGATAYDMGAYERASLAQYNITLTEGTPDNGAPNHHYGVTIAANGVTHVETPYGPALFDGGSAMVIATNSPQVIDADNRRVFASWYDGSTTTYTTNRSFTHSGPVTFTLNFDRQYRTQLTTVGGTATMTPADGWVNSGANVSYSAPVPNLNFTFSHWTNAIAENGSVADPWTFAVTAPTNIQAVFVAAGEVVNIQTDPVNLDFNADGTGYNNFQSFSWTDTSGGPPGHILYATNMIMSSTSQYRMNKWNDSLNGDIAGSNYTFFVDGPATYTITAYFDAWWKLTTSFDGTIGNVTTSAVPVLQDGFYVDGDVIQLTAAPSAVNYIFNNWSGDASGSDNPLNVTMTSAKNITANFRRVVFVDAGAGGAANGTSWGNAYTSLDTAVDTEPAGTAGSPLEFWVADGIYARGAAAEFFTLKDYHQIYGGFVGTETARSQRDLAGNPSAIIDGASIDGLATAYIQNANPANYVLDGLTIQNVRSTTKVGAIYVYLGANAAVRHCTFKNNAGNYGAGIGQWTGNLTVENCLFNGNTGNDSSRGGAGIWTRSRPCTLSVINSTFVNNVPGGTATTGHDIYRSASCTLTLKNSILWSGNTPIYDDAAPGSTVASYSDIRLASGTYTGTGNINTAPLFVSLAGGNLSLYSGSPGLDVANATGAPTDDIEGDTRPQDDDGDTTPEYDMGAYEGAVALADVTPPANATAVGAVGAYREIDVSWTAPGDVDYAGVLIVYKVGATPPTATPSGTYSVGDSCGDGIVGYAGAVSPATITGLLDDTLYSVRVYSYDAIPNYANGSGATAAATTGPSEPYFVDSTPSGGGNNGSSWANAFTDLQSAIAVAGGSPAHDIWVAAGTYKPGTLILDKFAVPAGVTIYGGFAGTESSVAARTTPMANACILSGDINSGTTPGLDAGNSTIVVHLNGNNSGIDGFTVEQGYSSAGTTFGVGIKMEASGLTVRNCIIRNNSGAYGGGIGGYPGSAKTGQLIENCVFTGNTAPVTKSATAAFFRNLGVMTMRNCTFAGNDSPSEASFTIRGGVTLSLQNCILWDSIVSGWSGGFKRHETDLPTVNAYNCDVQGTWINGTAAFQQGTGYNNGVAGTMTLASNPLFTNAGGGDYSLVSGSPCIDTGYNTYTPATDIAGTTRPKNGGTSLTVDIGAYEFTPQATTVLKFK